LKFGITARFRAAYEANLELPVRRECNKIVNDTAQIEFGLQHFWVYSRFKKVATLNT
jgi:hypothetical protein